MPHRIHEFWLCCRTSLPECRRSAPIFRASVFFQHFGIRRKTSSIFKKELVTIEHSFLGGRKEAMQAYLRSPTERERNAVLPKVILEHFQTALGAGRPPARQTLRTLFFQGGEYSRRPCPRPGASRNPRAQKKLSTPGEPLSPSARPSLFIWVQIFLGGPVLAFLTLDNVLQRLFRIF